MTLHTPKTQKTNRQTCPS